MEAEVGMLLVETIAKIRRAYFVDGRPIKAICRELGVSRKVRHGNRRCLDRPLQSRNDISKVRRLVAVFRSVTQSDWKRWQFCAEPIDRDLGGGQVQPCATPCSTVRRCSGLRPSRYFVFREGS